jgi:hypothetical protein
MFLGLINKSFSFVSEEIDPSPPIIFAGGYYSVPHINTTKR